MDNQPNNNPRPPRQNNRGSQPGRPTGQPGRSGRPQGRSDKPAQNSGRGGRGPARAQTGDQKAAGGSGVSRGAAVRAQKRTQMDAQKYVNQYASAAMSAADPERARANTIVDNRDKLKITFLGGQEAIGEKNMQVIEWQDDAVILDCGNDLSVDLPGINYTVNDPAYLETIKHKIRAYIISHGHLDHLGGLKHIVPKYPAPIYGSGFTLDVVRKTFEDAYAETGVEFAPQFVVMNMDNHERLKIGAFFVELVRITHSVPEASCIVLDTPVGRLINTGDFRLDPEPLDNRPSDVARLQQLGDEGVLALLSESTYTNTPGRQLTEHTLQQSFHDIISQAEGRVFVSIFSSNMNRIQMIINAAVAAGRKVALDGRSMMNYAEIAVRQGILKVPRGTVLAMQNTAGLPDNQILVVCTGGQGEPGSALQRMADGEHRHVKLHEGDTVVVSSNPIPGNEVRYEIIGNELAEKGVHLFRNPSHEIDGCGPLHVGGHARRDEHREMMRLVRPKFFIPIYAGALNRRYHGEIAIEEGWARQNVIQAKNGESFLFTADKWEPAGEVPHGSLLVDQTGSIVSNVVVKDRVLLSEEGLVAVVLTVDKRNGSLLTSPDIISRGFIYMREQEEIMNGLRAEVRRAVQQRFKRVDLDRFKAEIKDHITHYLFEQTKRSPIVIPVVNVIGGKTESAQTVHQSKTKTAEEIAAEQQRRFQEMRARLLGQDQPD
ncbi:MAG TPA: ribonuclease J [Candidatus Saccharimonadales bacterium]|nr:ribonuclease J [Candidatus Saccharimonadales bacterium]